MKNFYDFYKLCKNPLYDDEVLKKVLKAYREMAKYIIVLIHFIEKLKQ